MKLQLAPGLGAVRADPGQIEQGIMNLAVNARDAMPREGRVTISTENKPPSVTLRVSDTGAGIDAETQTRIFEPFFVHGIVEQHAGTVHVESAAGLGTTFTISFPLVDEVPEPVTASPPRAGARGPRPRMSGPDLAHRLRAAQPRVKILYISGYTAEKLDHHGLADAGVALKD